MEAMHHPSLITYHSSLMNSFAPIRHAVIPAAGLGTRLLPLSRALPKEMLPVGRRPVLEYILDELRAAGIERALLVISEAKEAIRQYFGAGGAGLRLDYAIQPEQRGLGDAILCAEEWAADNCFVVALGDCLIEEP